MGKCILKHALLSNPSSGYQTEITEMSATTPDSDELDSQGKTNSSGCSQQVKVASNQYLSWPPSWWNDRKNKQTHKKILNSWEQYLMSQEFLGTIYTPGPGCSKVGKRYPPDKSISNGRVDCFVNTNPLDKDLSVG